MKMLMLFRGTLMGVGLANALIAPHIIHRSWVPQPQPLRVSGRCSLVASAGKALIVQNKGGGHGELGYHLALKLIEKDISVTLLQDGGGSNKNEQPFASYGDLESKGARIVWGDFKEGVGKLLPDGEAFDYVFDNYAKDVGTCQDVATSAKEWGVKNYAYVSSAGMYKDSDEVPFTESSSVKESSGQRQVEEFLAQLDLPWTSFRPQYIYGPLTNKRDYLDWFFDRVVYDLEIVPLPVHGDQLVTLTHAADVASMLASVIGNDGAVKQVFNCASDRFISYSGLFQAVAKVAGPSGDKVAFLYDPSDYDIAKGWFPFRNNHFFVSSDKAKQVLKWRPEHTIVDDLEEYYEGYKAAGKHEAEPDFTMDDAINLSWHHDYVPYIVRREMRQKYPDLDQELAEIEANFDETDRHHYSATLEIFEEIYREAHPDEPDPEEELKAEYEAYMAAHPGLAERLARQEEEYMRNNFFSTIEEFEELKKKAQEEGKLPR